MALIDSNKLIDVFYFGKNDLAITGDSETDGKVIEIIKEQPEVEAIPKAKIDKFVQTIETIEHFNGVIKASMVLALLKTELER